LLSLVYQITQASYQPLPAGSYSPGLVHLVDQLLTKDPAARPSLQQVLSLQFVHQHLERFNMQVSQHPGGGAGGGG
jgi:hypothetical protein